jgi:hypothetical protein
MVEMGSVPKDKIDKGVRAEQAFKTWLNVRGYSFIYLDQSVESFPAKFRDQVKRPDFLIGLFRFGSIFVDVKGHRPYQDEVGAYFSLPVEEAEQYRMLETFMGLPVWLAYVPEEEAFKVAYFFPASLVINLSAIEYNGKRFKKIHMTTTGLKRVPLDGTGRLSTLCELT